MKKVTYLLALSSLILMSSCVSKKKLSQAENKLMSTESELSKARNEARECGEESEDLKATVAAYNQKINNLQQESKNKIAFGEDGNITTEKSKQKMRNTFQNISPERAKAATSLKDSMNIAIAYNIEQKMKSTFANNANVDVSTDENAEGAVAAENTQNQSSMEGLSVDVSHPVVKITINNSILFKSGSSWVNASAHPLISQLAELIKSEPNMEVLVEGHADAQKIVPDSYLEDNWVLASKRAIAVVRLMEGKFEVDGAQLIASSRSFHKPVADNETAEGRAKNRRTTITLMPNVEKFMALIED